MKEIERKEYTDDYYRVRSLNHTLLCVYREDPALFWDLWYGRKLPEEGTRTMETGSMIHSAILTPDEFKERYFLLEGEKPRSANMERFCEEIIKGKTPLEAYLSSYRCNMKDAALQAEKLFDELKDYILCKEENRIPVTREDMDRVESILISYQNHKGVQEVTRLGDFSLNELEVRFRHPCGLPCKAKLDRVQVDREKKKIWILDLKTASHSPKKFVRETEREYNTYLQQLAYYTMAMRNTYELEKDWKFEYYLVYIGSHTHNVYLIRTDDYSVRCTTFMGITEDRMANIDGYIEKIREEEELHRERTRREGTDFEIGYPSQK